MALLMHAIEDLIPNKIGQKKMNIIRKRLACLKAKEE